MNTIISLAKRNLLVFFRDRSAVFFSFLSVLIIIGLYALFLADIQVKSIKSIVGDVAGARFLVDSWIMAGLLAVNTVTVSLGALAIMVKDRDKKVLRDFLVAPIKRSYIVFSYIVASFVIGAIISITGLILMEGYIYYSGGQLLSSDAIIKVFGIILLSVLCSSSLMFFISTFIKSTSAFSTLSTIMGTMIGFLVGIYVPIGVMPSGVQMLIKIIPMSHVAAIFRQIFMEEPLKMVFEHAPIQALENYKETYGINFKLNGNEINSEIMIMYVLVMTAIFMVAGIIRVKYIRER